MATDQRILDETDVHERAQQGDEDAIASVYRSHFARLVRLCATRVGDEAEDVAQEALLVGLAALPRLDDAVAFWRYVRRVALNECADRRQPGPRFVELDEGVAPTTALGSTVEHDEHVEAIRHAVARLSAGEQAALALSATDYAETYGVSLANARQLRHRARARFARLHAAIEARFVAIPVVRAVLGRMHRAARKVIDKAWWEQGAALAAAVVALGGAMDRGAVNARGTNAIIAALPRGVPALATSDLPPGHGGIPRAGDGLTRWDGRDAQVRDVPSERGGAFGALRPFVVTYDSKDFDELGREMDVYVATSVGGISLQPCELTPGCVIKPGVRIRYVGPGADAPPEPLSVRLPGVVPPSSGDER